MGNMHALARLRNLPLLAPAWDGISSRHVRIAMVCGGLTLILIANHWIRRKLERTEIPPYPVFQDNVVPISWQLLLPTDLGDGGPINQKGTYHWLTTGLTVIKIFEQYYSRNAIFYALNALLIAASFACSWWMFRSLVFSFTIAICMAFGTQFHWVYNCSPVMALYLFAIYLQAVILTCQKVITTGDARWKAAYLGSLIVFALNHEQWLDYVAFVVIACPFLWLCFRRAELRDMQRRVVFVLVATMTVTAIYLSIRLQYGGQQHRRGDESEMIFSYSMRTLAVEDFFSNVLTYLYLSISNYFPPCLVSSNSLYLYGAERIMAEQNGYHPDKNHLVAMHHVFYWYFFAGIVFAAFMYFLVRNAWSAYREANIKSTYLTMAMLLIAAGFAIHALVKYRPYLSVPLLTYKCTTSNVGVAFLLGLALMYARDWLPSRKWQFAIVVVIWGVVIYGAFARPAYLTHLSREVGMSDLPDPMRNLSK